MAEALANRKGLQAKSAGTVPVESVNPTVVEAMAEKAFNLSLKKPKMLTMEMIDQADLVVTMGCSVEKVCPKPMLAQMQKKLIDWNLKDPKGKSLPEVRRIRNEIEKRVEELARSTAWFRTIDCYAQLACGYDRFFSACASLSIPGIITEAQSINSPGRSVSTWNTR